MLLSCGNWCLVLFQSKGPGAPGTLAGDLNQQRRKCVLKRQVRPPLHVVKTSINVVSVLSRS